MRSTEKGSARSPVFIFDFGGVVIKWKNNNPIFDYIAERYGTPRAETRRAFELALPRLESGDVSIREFLEEVLGETREAPEEGRLARGALEAALRAARKVPGGHGRARELAQEKGISGLPILQHLASPR